MEIIERLQILMKTRQMTSHALAKEANIDSSNFAKMLNGDQKITKKTLGKILDAFHLNPDWLVNGRGEMYLEPDIMVQNNSGGNNQQGHQNQQIANSEKLFNEYVASLKDQSVLTLKSMTQTNTAMENVKAALAEISEQRKQMDRLITMIENLQSK